jgi:hypothetical protein
MGGNPEKRQERREAREQAMGIFRPLFASLNTLPARSQIDKAEL